MKSIFNLALALFAISFITLSCDNDTKVKTVSKKEIIYSNANTSLQWTAYKTTDKIGVKGTFKNIIIENSTKAESVENIINTTKFKIPTSSTFTGNEPRDVLIKNFFFGAMMDTDTIYGSFSSTKNGIGKVSIKMNNVVFENSFTYIFDNDSLKIKSTLELDNWNGYSALSSLHEKCFDKHTGADGVSKTWSDVDILITSVLK